MKSLSLCMLAACSAAFQFSYGQVCFTPNPVNGISSIGSDHTDIASGNINGDNLIDLVVTNHSGSSGNTISVLRGNGFDGNGQPTYLETQHNVGNKPYALYLNDFDGDNDTDIAVSNEEDGTITILKNNGTGNMAPTTISVGSKPQGITGGYFNADAYLDLAIANYNGKSIKILYGQQNGTFVTTVSPVDLGNYSPSSLIAGDFDNDGFTDICVSLVYQYDGHFRFLKGTGTSFTIQPVSAPFGINAAWQMSSIDTADFNGDGVVDIAMLYPDGGGIQKVHMVWGIAGNIGNIFPSNQEPYSLNTTQPAFDFTVADFNGDGNPDIAAILRAQGSIPNDSMKVMLGNGNAQNFMFLQKSFHGTYSQPLSITHADFNADGKPDLASGNFAIGVNISPIYTGINTTPYFNITGDEFPLCGQAPQTAPLAAASTQSLTYTWQPGAVNGAAYGFTLNSPMNYFSVSGDDGFGCYNTSFGKVRLISVNTSVTAANGMLTATAQNSTYQWLGCALPFDTIIPSATGQSYTPTLTGSYAVEVTTSGCVDTSTCHSVIIPVNPLTVSDIESGEAAINIYPNPSNGNFSISLAEGSKNIQSVIVRDLYGHVVFYSAGEKQMNLTLSAGSYFIEVNDSEHKFLKRIIIQ